MQKLLIWSHKKTFLSSTIVISWLLHPFPTLTITLSENGTYVMELYVVSEEIETFLPLTLILSKF